MATTEEEEAAECTICFDALVSAVHRQLPCGHSFHEHCLNELRLRSDATSSRCPYCTQDVPGLLPVKAMLHKVAKGQCPVEECLTLLREICAVDENHAEANFRLGVIYQEGQGVTVDREAARRHFERAHSKGHLSAAMCLGLHFQQKEDYAAALPFFLHAQTQGHVAASLCLGKLYWEQGHAAEASQMFEEARRSSDTENNILFGCSCLDDHLGEEAERFFLRAKELGGVEAVMDTGIFLQQRGLKKRAKACFLEARAEGHFDAAVCLGELAEHEGQLEEAKAFYTEGHESGNLNGTIRLGLFHWRQDEHDLAEPLLRAGSDLAVQLGHCMVHTVLGHICLLKGDREDAVRFYTLAHANGIKKAAQILASLHAENGDLELARSVLEQICDHWTVFRELGLGNLSFQEGDAEKAKEHFEAAYNKGDDLGGVHLHYWYKARGDWVSAEDTLEVLQTSREGPALVMLGMYAELTEDYEAAENFYTQVLTADKSDWKCGHLLLASLYQKMGSLERSQAILPTSEADRRAIEIELVIDLRPVVRDVERPFFDAWLELLYSTWGREDRAEECRQRICRGHGASAANEPPAKRQKL